MICCVVGKGSIGKRHSNILENLNIKVLFLRRRPDKKEKNEISYDKKKLNEVNFFIISNPSSLHLRTIKKLIDFNKPIFVEKPLITQKTISKKIIDYNKLFVLYQMRFDPRIKFIKKEITHKKIKKAKFTWKTFLPDWHKYENYKKSYASRKKLGGGVIFTMSHEIDTAINLLGKVKTVSAKKNRNILKIDVEDNIKIKLQHNRNFKSDIDLNFASKKQVRTFKIETEDNFYSWNFFENKIYTKNKTFKFNLKNENIYKKQMKNLLLILKHKNYEKSEIQINKILHTQSVINACTDSLKKKKIIKLF